MALSHGEFAPFDVGLTGIEPQQQAEQGHGQEQRGGQIAHAAAPDDPSSDGVREADPAAEAVESGPAAERVSVFGNRLPIVVERLFGLGRERRFAELVERLQIALRRALAVDPVEYLVVLGIVHFACAFLE